MVHSQGLISTLAKIPSLGEGIVGGDLPRGIERGRLDHDQAAIHGLAVRLGEGPGKDERLAEALEIGEMVRAVRLAGGKAAGLSVQISA